MPSPSRLARSPDSRASASLVRNFRKLSLLNPPSARAFLQLLRKVVHDNVAMLRTAEVGGGRLSYSVPDCGSRVRAGRKRGGR